ncbi:hypothetical protein ACHAWF_008531 [Thalassiosira exigua]
MFARQLCSEGEARGFKCRAVDLQDAVENEDQFSLKNAVTERPDLEDDEEGAAVRGSLADKRFRDEDQRSRAVFLMATYGEGEPTDNAAGFVECLKGRSGIDNIYKVSASSEANGDANGGNEQMLSAGSSISLEDLPQEGLKDPKFMDDVDYAVFGLGNRQYEHYNNMSRFVDAAMERCGAKRVASLGLGDDDDDLEGDFENWKDNILWPALTEKYVKGNIVKREEEEGTELPPSPYLVEYSDEKKATQNGTNKHLDTLQTTSRHYAQALDCPLSAKRELRDPSDPGSTLHMEIDISQHEENLKYVTADNLGILPKNPSSVVESVAKALSYDLDRTFHLAPNPAHGDPAARHQLPFPTPCTVRECLERYCDLTGPPRRSDLKRLASYARDEVDRKALLRMSSREGKKEYKEKVVEAHVGIADIVGRLCKSIACPLEHFVAVCPRLQPRYYTISSSSTVHPTTVHITLALLETERKDGGKFTGLCSGYLAGLEVGDAVRAFVRESTFRLPKQIERPVLMFGPGTGIAPMRAVLQERSHGRKLGEGHGPSVLYFGCKNRTMDYIYRDELEGYREEGTLTELHLAFSREQKEKVYVQHLLAKRAEVTWKLIHEDKASIFVCGAVKMGADVDHTLQDIISQQGGMTREKAKAYLDKMAMAGRFVQELWS